MHFTKIAITGEIVVVLYVTVFIKSQQVLTQGVYEAESSSFYHGIECEFIKKGTYFLSAELFTILP